MFKLTGLKQNHSDPQPRKFTTASKIRLGLGLIALVVTAAMLLGILSVIRVNSPQALDKSSGENFYSTSSGASSGNASSYPVSAAGSTQAAASGAVPRDAAAGVPQKGIAQNSASYTNSAPLNIPPGLLNDRMIIKNANLDITVENVDKFLGDIRGLATEQKGAVTQASTTLRNDRVFC